MNMKLKNEFKEALRFSNEEEKIEHDAKILMFKFLSLIEDEMTKRDMSKKELAALLKTSPSYVTQLFRGTKTINLIKLAQLQKLFNVEFEIKTNKSSEKSNQKSLRAAKNSKKKSLAIAR